MNIWKRPRSPYYSYKFAYRGKIYCRSTGTANKREAESVAAAARSALIRQLAGLEKPVSKQPLQETKSVPTLRQFKAIFDAWVGTAKEEQQGTVSFYRENY